MRTANARDAAKARSSLASSRGPSEQGVETAISVEHVTKSYGDHVAVRDLSFSVQQGEIFALLGPNGAGKTTTIEMLEGYRSSDSGEARILGLHPIREARALKPKLGVMLQQDGLYPDLRPREVLALFAQYFAQPEDPDVLIQRVGLTDALQTRCRRLSGGQKRRLALAVALIGKPRLLFLDEPTTGMDPQARRATWDIIHELKEQGVTVLLTTHFMDEAERLADRIAIMDNGSLIALDTPAGLTRSQSTTTTEVFVSAKPGLDVALLAKLPAARAAREEVAGHYVIETGDTPALLVELTTWLREKGGELVELRVGRSSLEDVFLRLTGKEIRE